MKLELKLNCVSLYSIEVPGASPNLQFIQEALNLYKMKPFIVFAIFTKSDGLQETVTHCSEESLKRHL